MSSKSVINLSNSVHYECSFRPMGLVLVVWLILVPPDWTLFIYLGSRYFPLLLIFMGSK